MGVAFQRCAFSPSDFSWQSPWCQGTGAGVTIGTWHAAMAASPPALTEPSLCALAAPHPLSVWWEGEEEERVDASLEVEAEVVVDVVDVGEGAALEGLLRTRLRKTTTLAKTMTMKEDVLSDHLVAVALMVLGLLARTTSGQTLALTGPRQPGFHLAQLGDDQGVPTTRGLSALMEPDPTTANAGIPAHRLAPMEQLPFVWTAAPQLQGQSVQTSTLMWSFSGFKKGGPTKTQPLTMELPEICLTYYWQKMEISSE